MTFWIAFRRCGWDRIGGDFPEVRLGIVAFGWCRGVITQAMRDAIKEAMASLGEET